VAGKLGCRMRSLESLRYDSQLQKQFSIGTRG